MYEIIIGHRGAAGLALENSMEAFDIAKKLDLEWVETDIRMTSDGVLVLWHNSFYKDLIISESPFAKLKTASSNQIVEIEQLILKYKNKFNFNFDVKDINAFPQLLDLIRKHAIDKQVLISSFHHMELIRIQSNNNLLDYAPIIASRPFSIDSFLIPFKGKMNKIVVDFDFCDNEMILECQKNNFELYAFNIHSKKQISSNIKEKIKGIIVDDPKLFK